MDVHQCKHNSWGCFNNKNDITGWSRAAKRGQRATSNPIWAGETTQKMLGPEEPGTRGPFRGRAEGSENETGKFVLDCENVWAESKKFTGIPAKLISFMTLMSNYMQD